MMSMSITDLKALTESWLMDARKFPAAPALDEVNVTLAIMVYYDCG